MYKTYFSEDCFVYEIMWKKCGRATQAADSNKIRHMCFARWKNKAGIQKHTHTYSTWESTVT